MGLKTTYNPDRDISNLPEKVFFITGGTSGIGRQTILALSKHRPRHIYFTGRDHNGASTVIAEAKRLANFETELTFITCDQTSLQSVAEACKLFLKVEDRLDVLICNAGIMAVQAALTQDGYEMQFGVNHLAHALFIKLLLPVLGSTARRTHEARIVSVASLAAAHTPSGGIAFDTLRTPQDNLGITGKWLRYGQSKLANILYTSEVARRYPKITAVSLDPGTVWTGLFRKLGFFDWLISSILTRPKTIPLHEGAYNSCWAATSEAGAFENGKMYKLAGVRASPCKFADNEGLAATLWEWTQAQLKDYTWSAVLDDPSKIPSAHLIEALPEEVRKIRSSHSSRSISALFKKTSRQTLKSKASSQTMKKTVSRQTLK